MPDLAALSSRNNGISLPGKTVILNCQSAALFYVTKALVVVLEAVAAEIAPQLPALALCFPALMLTNAVFLHSAL